MPCSLIMTATSSAVTALTKIGSVEGLKRRNLVVRDGGAKKKFAVFVASLSIEPHMYIEIDHERIVGDCHDFSPNSSRIGEQNLLFFPRGERVRFYLNAADDQPSSLKAKGAVLNLSARSMIAPREAIAQWMRWPDFLPNM